MGQIKETRNQAIVVGANGYAVNTGHLDIGEPMGDNYFEYEHGNIPNQPGVRVKNIALCALAALEDNPAQPGNKKLADNATLINRGTIDIHFDKIYKLYIERKMRNGNPHDVEFDTVRCYAMAAGNNSLLVNEGTINIYFDQDIDAEVSLYGCAIWANVQSLMINRGQINFIGNGSWQSYIRGIGSMASNLQVINEGEVNVNLKRAYQTRILHTAGTGGSLTNNGKIRVETGGRIMVLGALAGTRMTNNGDIEVISHSIYLKNKVSYHYQFNPLATAYYEHFLPNNVTTCPMVNRGHIKVHLLGSEESGENAVAFGFYLMQIGKSESSSTHLLVNEGSVDVTQEGPIHYTTAEVGINIQSPGDCAFNVKIGHWKTKLRDFAETKDLIVCRSANVDLSEMDLDGYEGDRSACVYQTEPSRLDGEECKITL